MLHLLGDTPAADPQTHLQTASGNNYWQPAAVIAAALIAALIGQYIAHRLNDKRERLKTLRQFYADFGAAAWRYLWQVEVEAIRTLTVQNLVASRSFNQPEKDWDGFVKAANEEVKMRVQALHDMTKAKFGLLAHLDSDELPTRKAHEEIEQMYVKVEVLQQYPVDRPSKTTNEMLTDATKRVRNEVREWVKARIDETR